MSRWYAKAILWLGCATAVLPASAGNPGAPGSDGASAAAPRSNAPVIFRVQDPLAEDAQTRSIEVYDRRVRTLGIPMLRGAVSMDEDVCRASVADGQLRILGVARGEAVVIYWTEVEQVNLLVHVVDEPVVAPRPTLLYGAGSGSAGFLRSLGTMNVSGGAASLLWQNQFAWTSRLAPERELSVEGITEDASQRYGRGFNLTSLGITWKAPTYEARLGDFGLALRPETASPLALQFPTPILALRGADISLRRGRDSYEAFAGLGVPSFFLHYGGLARAAGVNYRHAFGAGISLLVHGMLSSATPSPFSPQPGARQNDFTLLPVLSARLSRRLSLESGLGASSHGVRLTSEAAYRDEAFSLFAGYSRMPQQFPLQLLRSGSTPGQNLALGGSYRFSSRWTVLGSYQRHFAEYDRTLATSFGASNNLSVSTQYQLSRIHALSAAYSAGQQVVAGAGVLRLRRLEVGLGSQFRALSNNFQMSLLRNDAAGANPNRHTDLSLMDAVRHSLRPGVQLTGGVAYTRTNFPLLLRLEQQIGLLSPELQQLFQTDPVAFLNSNLLPESVRAALNDVQPANLQINAGAELSGGRWSLAPQTSFGLQRTMGAATHNAQFGYRLTYRLKPNLWLESSLAGQYYAVHGGVQRTNILTFGMQKSLASSPVQWLSSRLARGEIRGHVFVDKIGDGSFHDGEPPLAGITVRLSNGASAVTDAQGGFVFHALAMRSYTVSLGLDQFRSPVRLTGPSERTVELASSKSAQVDFGVVNFARVVGVLYNDYLLTGERQPDAPLLGDIRLALRGEDGRSREVTADASGGFEFGDLEPGGYELAVVEDSLPAGYSIPGVAKRFELAPVSTASQEVGLQPMHTIAGRVVLRPDPSSPARPLAGVQIAAEDRLARTGADGSFVLRRLPGTDLTVRVLPNSAAPATLELPQGRLRMPHEPRQVEAVNIIITDPALLPYILPAESAQGGAAAGR